jgi:hypothetical protein
MGPRTTDSPVLEPTGLVAETLLGWVNQPPNAPQVVLCFFMSIDC